MKHLWQIPKWIFAALGSPFWLIGEMLFRLADFFDRKTI